MKKKIKVGIIGGGQLGMMLAQASSKLNITPLIYSNTKDSPAAKVAKVYLGNVKVVWTNTVILMM